LYIGLNKLRRVICVGRNYLVDTFLGKIYDRKRNQEHTGWKYKGYIMVDVNSEKIGLHRLIYQLYHQKTLPRHIQVDHIDGDKQNNSILNLRAVSAQVNCLNKHKARKDSKSGIIGIYCTKSKKYRAEFRHDKLGTFNTLQEAIEARERAKEKFLKSLQEEDEQLEKPEYQTIIDLTHL
jgi:HNH endonuclease